mmetsp:Transcript_78902/g.241454  ORF Transcript_78902/g.241454 Transcript_78902/m.241454 type:complete len:202 (-) Transcript_78902:416-1021(-)
MSFTSKPRPATPVATMIGASPLRNDSMAFSRSTCFLLPCKVSTLALFSAILSFLATSSHSSGLPAKISTLPGFFAWDAYCFRSKDLSAPSLSPSSLTIMIRWSTSRLARKGSFIPTRTSTACRVIHVAKSLTSSANVAEKSAVCLCGDSTSQVILRMLVLRPSPIMWSASSRTRNRTVFTLNQCASFSMKSARRPTVPTTH